tara:strand:- start:315 stop:941 length:627 start_codon:yes stop_codon:yes gene_type:complete
MKTELLIQMDGLARSDDLVFVLAASNIPWSLDGAMLRRLEKRIMVALPKHNAREAMFRKMLGRPVTEQQESNGKEGKGKEEEEKQDVQTEQKVATGVYQTSGQGSITVDATLDYHALADRSDGYSGADIRLIVKEAAMRPLRRMMQAMEDIDLSSDAVVSTTTSESLIAKIGPITVDDMNAALDCTKPSSGFKAELYVKWHEEFGSAI